MEVVPDVPVPEEEEEEEEDPAQNPESSSAQKIEPGAVDQAAFNGLYLSTIASCKTAVFGICQTRKWRSVHLLIG